MRYVPNSSGITEIRDATRPEGWYSTYGDIYFNNYWRAALATLMAETAREYGPTSSGYNLYGHDASMNENQTIHLYDTQGVPRAVRVAPWEGDKGGVYAPTLGQQLDRPSPIWSVPEPRGGKPIDVELLGPSSIKRYARELAKKKEQLRQARLLADAEPASYSRRGRKSRPSVSEGEAAHQRPRPRPSVSEGEAAHARPRPRPSPPKKDPRRHQRRRNAT